jgi:hypothetical protein
MWLRCVRLTSSSGMGFGSGGSSRGFSSCGFLGGLDAIGKRLYLHIHSCNVHSSSVQIHAQVHMHTFVFWLHLSASSGFRVKAKALAKVSRESLSQSFERKL